MTASVLIRTVMLVAPAALRRRIQAALGRVEGVTLAAEGEGTPLAELLARGGVDLVVADPESLSPAQLAAARQAADPPEVLVVAAGAPPEQRGAFQAAGALAVVDGRLGEDALGEVLGVMTERLRRLAVERLQAGAAPRSTLADFASDSPAMKKLLALARRVAMADSSLLLLGETGVGKEWLARAIHGEGPRAQGPFVAVNCGAVPEGLLESELFGHERGAFTGAVRTRKGAFELAHRGTLFLDEIGELPLHLQVKLLRVVQERTAQKVGAEALLEVDVRIVAATNRDLEAALQAGNFRRDLFYRLSVVTLTVPPLRDRSQDIVRLVESYLAHFRDHLRRFDLTGIEERAVEAMRSYSWPGNVRELINVLERAVLLCEGQVIGLADLPEAIGGPRGATTAPGPGAGGAGVFGPWLSRPLGEGRRSLVESFEREYLTRLLSETRGNVGETALRAGIDPRTLYNKMRAYGLRKEEFRGSGA